MQREQEVWERFIMIVKPEQSGKTFVMIKKINEFLRDEEESDRITVNFIFCDNSLLLTKQTKERIRNDVCLPDTEEPYVEFSSRKDGSAKGNSSEVRDAIEDGCRNILCCTNGKRVYDILSIINRMNKHNANPYNFKIWLDEADKFDNYIKNQFIPLCQQHNNVEVYMLTATPQPIFNRYKEVRTMALENTTLPTYHGWNDCDIQIREDESRTTLGFAQQIACEMKENGLLSSGVKGYVPADSKKLSHCIMRDIFISKGCAVFMVNGDGIELTLPSLLHKTIEKTEELHVHIRELYKQYNVSQWPCIVTGNICVGRGITLQQPDFMFDFGILSNYTKKTEASQNAGRLKGNFKNWPGYTPPRVYTTNNFNKVASEYEEQSREIAKIAFVNNGNSEGSSIVTQSEIKNIKCNNRYELIEDEFDTLDEANVLLKSYKCNRKLRVYTNEEGFILSSTTKKLRVLDYNEVKEEMKSWITTATLDTRNKKRKAYGRMYIAYKDIQDKDTVKYLVRIAVNKSCN